MALIYEIAFSVPAFIFNLFLLIFGEHRFAAGCFASLAFAFSLLTVYQVIETHRRIKGTTMEWHHPTGMQMVRICYSILLSVATLYDFCAYWRRQMVPVVTPFPAAFATVVFVTAIIDKLSLGRATEQVNS